MHIFIDPIPVQFPDLTDYRRNPVDVAVYPIYYTYKTAPAEETISICQILAKYLCRRLKYRDKQVAGVLGMSDGIVTNYYQDHYGRYDSSNFLPAPTDLNYITKEWRKIGIDFCGMICNHPSTQRTPTASELRFIAALLSFNLHLPSVLLGIVAGDEPTFFRFDRDFLQIWLENTK